MSLADSPTKQRLKLAQSTQQDLQPITQQGASDNCDDESIPFSSDSTLLPSHNDLPYSWYPVILSHELKNGQIKLIDSFDQQWIIFRNQQGKAVVFSRYCCHMGVDLLCAKVKGAQLICPMHEWRFAEDGACTQIPTQDPIPRAARQDTLPCVERYGIVFVYWGDKQAIAFDVPSYPELHQPMLDRAYYRTAYTPFLSIMLNAFDINHMKSVHHREVIEQPIVSKQHQCHLAIDMTTKVLPIRWTDHLTRLMGFRQANIRFDCWGGNLIMVSNFSAKFRVLLALAPTHDQHCKVYFVGAMEQLNFNPWQRLLRRLRLKATSFLGREFLKLDLPVFNGMQPKPGVLLKSADKYAIRFWQHWQQLPRHKEQREKDNPMQKLALKRDAR